MSNAKCAACTLRRKRCAADCIFAPYFPAEKADDFEKVCLLYGVQNVVNILKSATEEERSSTAETMVVEAKIRRERPVHGSPEIERQRDEIGLIQRELVAVQSLLELHKSEGKDVVDD